jgi:hypothetical protein
MKMMPSALFADRISFNMESFSVELNVEINILYPYSAPLSTMEFKARPVYLRDDDRIEAHFITCFISLIIYRFLEKRLKEQFTCSEIISELRDMNFKEIKKEGYEPIYTRTDFTDALHDSFGFNTDYQIVTLKRMRKILKTTKGH